MAKAAKKKPVSKGMKARSAGRMAKADRDQSAVREKMINALGMNSYKGRGQDGSKGSKPATYGNYPETKNKKNKARNAAHASGKDAFKKPRGR